MLKGVNSSIQNIFNCRVQVKPCLKCIQYTVIAHICHVLYGFLTDHTTHTYLTSQINMNMSIRTHDFVSISNSV